MRGVARGAGAAYGDFGKSTDATSRLWGVCVCVCASQGSRTREEFFDILAATCYIPTMRSRTVVYRVQNLHSCAMHACMHNACSGRHSMEGKLGPEPARRPKDQPKDSRTERKKIGRWRRKKQVCAPPRASDHRRPMSDLMNPWGSGTGTVQCTWTQGPLGMTSR